MQEKQVRGKFIVLSTCITKDGDLKSITSLCLLKLKKERLFKAQSKQSKEIAIRVEINEIKQEISKGNSSEPKVTPMKK